MNNKRFRRYKKQERKGFTMIELLATIIILGLLVSLAYFGVRGILDRGNSSYYNSQENMLILAGREYFSDHRSELPEEVGKTSNVTLETLINESYIDKIIDENENACDITKSSVTSQKITDKDYQYYGVLTCNNYKTTADEALPVIKFRPNKKSSTESINITMSVTDNAGVASYRYVITKDGEEYRDSNYQIYNGEIQIKLTEKGLYEITGYAIDVNGNTSSRKSGKYSIYEGIDCSQVEFTSETKALTWTNEDVTVNVKLPANTYRWDLSKRVNGGEYENINNYTGLGNQNITLDTDGKVQLRLVLYDNAGNSCTATSEQYYIDKTAPTCVSSGGSTSWTSKNVTLIGTCSDNLSGCTGNAKKTFNTEGQWYNQSPGSVSDNAGNTTPCPADQTVKIASAPTKPDIYLNGYNTGSWTNGNVTISMGSTSNIGIDHYEYSHDGVNWINDFNNNPTGWNRVYTSSDKSSMNVTISWEGNWNFYIRAVDKAGNVSPTSNMFTIRIDKTPPVVSLTSSQSGCVNAPTQVWIALVAQENGSGIASWQISYDGFNASNIEGTTGVKEGLQIFSNIMNQNVYFRAYDNAGNYSSFVGTNICINASDPDVNFTISCWNSCAGRCNLNGYNNDRIWQWDISGAGSGLNIWTAKIVYSTVTRPNYCTYDILNAPYGSRSGCGYAVFESTRFQYSRSYAQSSIVGRVCTNNGKCAECIVYN